MTTPKSAFGGGNPMNKYEPPSGGDGKPLGFIREDIRKFYHCLGHRPGAFTEFRAIDLNGQRHPVVRYIDTADKLETLVKKTHRDYMPCIGINERPAKKLNDRGYPIAAKEKDIQFSQNVFLDFDTVAAKNSELLQSARDRYFQNEFCDYCRDIGFATPSMLVASGNGNHAYFSYRPIPVADHPDITARLKNWMGEVASDQKDELDRLELKLDTSTADLGRVVKIPGTAKPGGHVSRLIYANRQEDEALRGYLLSMPAEKLQAPFNPIYGASLLTIANDNYHPIVRTLIRTDPKIRAYANGQGKPEGTDRSRSGYLYSFAQALMFRGVRNLDILGSSLAVLAEHLGKPVTEEYIRRTIAAALVGRR